MTKTTSQPAAPNFLSCLQMDKYEILLGYLMKSVSKLLLILSFGAAGYDAVLVIEIRNV